MKIGAECAQASTEAAAELLSISTEDKQERNDAEVSDNSDDRVEHATLDHIACLQMPVISDAAAHDDDDDQSIASRELDECICRATEDSDDDVDSSLSTSTLSAADDLISGLQDLCLQPADEEPVALVSRGPPYGTATCWDLDDQSWTRFAWPAPVQYQTGSDEYTVLVNVGPKRKIAYESAVGLQPPSLPNTTLLRYQLAPTYRDGIGCIVQQDDHEATKFRRPDNDLHQSVDCANFINNSSMTPALASGISEHVNGSPSATTFGDPGLVFDLDPERDLAACCPDIGSEPFPRMKENNDLLPLLESSALSLDHVEYLDDWTTFNPGVAQLNNLPSTTTADQNPDIVSQCHRSDTNGYAQIAMAGMSTVTGMSSDTSRQLPTQMSTAIYDNSPAAVGVVGPPVCYGPPVMSPSVGSASVLSPSGDSGFIDASGSVSPRSLPDAFTFPACPRDLPAEVIFEYVETQLKEFDEKAATKKKAVNGSRRMDAEQLSSLANAAAGPTASNYYVIRQQQQPYHLPTERHVAPTGEPSLSNVATGKVIAGDDESAERRRLAKASRTIAQLTRDQLMIIDGNGNTLLHIVLRKSVYLSDALVHRLDREELTACLVNQRNAFSSETPLILATAANKPRLVQLLVERGATVNAQVYESGSEGSGPFCAAVHIASSRGLPYLDTLRELLKAPALDLTVVDSQGRTALHRAVEVHGQLAAGSKQLYDSTDVVRLLVQHGADVDQPDLIHHKTALQWAVERVASLGSVQLVRHLLDVSSSMSGRRHRPDTATHLLSVAHSMATNDLDLQRQLVQLLTSNDCMRPSLAAAVVY